MKFLSRDFTLREKVLMIILAVLLVLVFYFYAVDMPLRDQKASLISQKENLDMELKFAEAKLQEYKDMEKELDKMDGKTSRMESYNNRTNEINFLNDLLSTTASYSLSFSPVKVDGNQVRREFSIAYSCSSYEEAMNLLERLSSSKYRCLIQNVSCTPASNAHTALTGAVSVTANAIFYETLVGKTTDAGLPVKETP